MPLLLIVSFAVWYVSEIYDCKALLFGTGMGAVIFRFLLSYTLWAIGLLVELFCLHKRRQIAKRNSNLIMILTLPVYQVFRWVFEVILYY